MQGRISVFGVIAGVLILMAYVVLLSGLIAPQGMTGTYGGILPPGKSPDSFAYTGMALGAVVLLISLMNEGRFRAVMFLALGYANMLVATNVLVLYSAQFGFSVRWPVSLAALTNFLSWSSVLNMKYPSGVVVGSLLSCLNFAGLFTLAMLLGAIHACVKATSETLPRILGALAAMTILIGMVISTGYACAINPEMWSEYASLGPVPVYGTVFGSFALLFGFASILVLILSIIPLFAPIKSRRYAGLSFRILTAMAVSLPAALFGVICWAGTSPGTAQTPSMSQWASLGFFTLIDCALAILPLVLMANGVSLILRRFAGNSASRTAPPLVESA
jgi:hypothetical protein